MDKIHLWPEENTIDVEGTSTTGVIIEIPDNERKHLWYQLPAEHVSALSKNCDPFVLATIFTAMRESRDLYLHGEVSPSLLRNLEEFQAAWECWSPNRYKKIEITADVEQERHKSDHSEKAAIAAFSGGVDSSFTVFRHHVGRCGRLNHDIKAGIMVHGFDIPLSQTAIFDQAKKKAAKMLANLNIDLIPIASNFRELGDLWGDAHGAAVASCLTLLQEKYSVGLIASTEPYNGLVLPWGSNPITDWLLSSDSFRNIHDGAAFTRSEKTREIAGWSEALQHLQVCWQGKQLDRNCGRCEKCIRTILNFRVIGLDLPQYFERDVTDNQITSLENLNTVQIAYLDEIHSAAKSESLTESWVLALEKCIEQNRRALKRKQNQQAASPKQDRWQSIRSTLALRTRLRQLVANVTSSFGPNE